MEKNFLKLRPLDYGAIGLALAVTVWASLAVYAGSGSSERVFITGAEGRWIFPRNATETVTVAGPLGDTVVELSDGRVRVIRSPCTNQTCVAAGGIRSHGQWIACLPNKVLVSIKAGGPSPEGGAPRGLDELDGASW
ncbi:MAG: NusG domain II-containing protein [Treponema sp.]|jgi:hypothetical protein|nr:NusG domain II-containing protein [Treponema sp.]